MFARIRHRAAQLLNLLDGLLHRIDRLQAQTEAIERNAQFNTLQALYALPRFQSGLRLQRFGFKAYSQHDEDGILCEIFRRIGTTSRVFVEFGVGDGLEANSTYLLLQGWKGLWIEADAAQYRGIEKNFAAAIASSQLMVENSLATPSNIRALIERFLQSSHIAEPPDLLSIDIDGNDYHVLSALDGMAPKVIVLEYNGNFRPPLRWVMPFDPNHKWDESMLFGASLDAFNDLLEARGYALVGCSIVGGNAFFVRKDLVGDKFEAPFTTENHYEPPRYWLSQTYRNQAWMKPAFPANGASVDKLQDK